MRRSDKSHSELPAFPPPFLPDEAIEGSHSAIADLRARMLKLEQQVMAQYTAMASYATIAQQNVETSRAESRSDIDRSQSTVIGLMEKLRAEMMARLSGADVRAGGMQSLTVDGATRLASLEEQLVKLTDALEIYARENTELKAKVARMVERDMSAEGWLVSNGEASELSLL